MFDHGGNAVNLLREIQILLLGECCSLFVANTQGVEEYTVGETKIQGNVAQCHILRVMRINNLRSIWAL